MSRNEGKAGGEGVSAFEPAFETGFFQFTNYSLVFQCVKCDKIRMTQPCLFYSLGSTARLSMCASFSISLVSGTQGCKQVPT